MSPLETALLYLELDMESPELVDVGAGQAAVFSARSPFKETANEDGMLLLPINENTCILAVADGLGGQPNGQDASSLALTTLANVIYQSLAEKSVVREAVLQGIDQANEMILKLGSGAATTLSVVEITDSTMRPYQIGDSIILVVGQRGKLKYQSLSHSPTGYAVESGFLGEDEAMMHDERHLVSNVVGDPNMRVDLGLPVKLNLLDTVLLASDGIADNFTIDEIIQRVRKGPLLTQGRRLVTEAYQRMTVPDEGQPSKADDYTFVCFRQKK